MGEVMKEAAFSLAEAKFTTGEFNQVVLQNVTKAQIKIRTKKDNVAGMFTITRQTFTITVQTKKVIDNVNYLHRRLWLYCILIYLANHKDNF